MRAKEVLIKIYADSCVLEDIKSALEDGVTLAALDITDADQEAVEEAHDMVSKMIKNQSPI